MKYYTAWERVGKGSPQGRRETGEKIDNSYSIYSGAWLITKNKIDSW